MNFEETIQMLIAEVQNSTLENKNKLESILFACMDLYKVNNRDPFQNAMEGLELSVLGESITISR